jgi:hypothetical protein
VEERRELVGRDIDYPSRLTAEDVTYLRGVFAEEMRRFEAISGLTLEGWGDG